MNRLTEILPIFKWLPEVTYGSLRADLAAGLTVGIMLIPQGMAYAVIAGLPPVYGLYAAFIPQIIYGFLGTSRQLAVGPVALDSLLVAAGIAGLAASGSGDYIRLAILLAFLTGAMQILFGLLRLGFFVNFLSKPVISGFTSAAALIIGFNQLKDWLGIEMARRDVAGIIFESFARYDEWHALSLTVGFFGLVFLYAIRWINRRWQIGLPAGLLVMVVGIVLSAQFDWQQEGLAVAGTVPAGLPGFFTTDFRLTWQEFAQLAPVALTLALVGYVEAISVAKAIGIKYREKYRIRPNQELIALGGANLVGSFFNSYPVTGGFSRSAVNDGAGAQTNLAALFTAAVIGLTLLYLTPLFYSLPMPVLASLVFLAVIRLIDVGYLGFLARTRREDMVMLLVTFFGTVALGILEGIGIGVVLSLAALIYRSTTPHYAVLANLPGTTDYRNIQRFKDLQERPDVLVFRYDAQLYFANINHFDECLHREVARKGQGLGLVVLHCGAMSDVDATAIEELKRIYNSLTKKGITVFFSGLIGPVRDFFQRYGFFSVAGEDHFFLQIQNAIDGFDRCLSPGDLAQQERAIQTNPNPDSKA